MAHVRFIAASLFSVSALLACADAETDGTGNAPSNGGESGEGASSQGGAPGQGAGPSDGGAPGQTVTNTATNNTVTNGTVTSAGPTTTSGGGNCMAQDCLIECFTMGSFGGTCVNGACECDSSSGSGFGVGGGFGFGGGFAFGGGLPFP